MRDKTKQTKQMAAQILSGLLSNPHIYASMGDEGSQAPQVKELVDVAIEIAEHLSAKVDLRHRPE